MLGTEGCSHEPALQRGTGQHPFYHRVVCLLEDAGGDYHQSGLHNSGVLRNRLYRSGVGDAGTGKEH